jgi:hypothetical protein
MIKGIHANNNGSGRPENYGTDTLVGTAHMFFEDHLQGGPGLTNTI